MRNVLANHAKNAHTINNSLLLFYPERKKSLWIFVMLDDVGQNHTYNKYNFYKRKIKLSPIL